MNGKKMKKRSIVRLSSYAIALVAVLAVWGITGSVKTENYKRQLSVAQQRTIIELDEYLEEIETNLMKIQYVNTSTMASSLAVSVCKSASGAKTCLAELSSGDTQLYNINKFLSQSGEYLEALNKKVTAGETISDDEHEQLAKLYKYASSLSESVSYMTEIMYAGDMDFEDTISTLSNLSDKNGLSVSYLDSISDAETSFSDYPTLLYDGPFSDNIEQKESDLLKGKEEISEAKAKELAEKYTGINKDKLIRQEDENSKIKSYVFYYDGTTVTISKNGGYLVYLLSDAYAGEEKYNEKEAVEKGLQFLDKCGYSGMKDSYYSTEDGICTVNYAYTLGDVICYTDLIKVSVAMDTGKIVSMEANVYIMNHKERKTPTAELTLSEAKEKVSSYITVTSCRMAIIPTDAGNETYAYEFLCRDKDKKDVLVYIDAKTGYEAEILLLLYSDGGVLTK